MTEQQFPDDDVEGQRLLQDPEASEGDVEGHSRARDVDDVEGHSRREDVADDVEGHTWTRTLDDQGDDDVAGHTHRGL